MGVAVQEAAVVDLTSNTVIGTPLDKLAARAASYQWNDGRLVVTGADGFVDTIDLGDKKGRRDVADDDDATSRRGDQGRPDQARSDRSRDQDSGQREASSHSSSSSRPHKSKSLFDLLFGN